MKLDQTYVGSNDNQKIELTFFLLTILMYKFLKCTK